MKIAMCYSGNLRSYEKTFDNQNKNVISNNNVNDIFILSVSSLTFEIKKGDLLLEKRFSKIALVSDFDFIPSTETS